MRKSLILILTILLLGAGYALAQVAPAQEEAIPTQSPTRKPLGMHIALGFGGDTQIEMASRLVMSVNLCKALDARLKLQYAKEVPNFLINDALLTNTRTFLTQLGLVFNPLDFIPAAQRHTLGITFCIGPKYRYWDISSLAVWEGDVVRYTETMSHAHGKTVRDDGFFQWSYGLLYDFEFSNHFTLGGYCEVEFKQVYTYYNFTLGMTVGYAF